MAAVVTTRRLRAAGGGVRWLCQTRVRRVTLRQPVADVAIAAAVVGAESALRSLHTGVGPMTG